jgi:hypothetical protein
MAGEDLRLAIERKVVAIFADQHVCEETSAGQPFRNRPLRSRCLMELAAGPAPVLRASDTDDAEPGWNVVQNLADRLANLVDRAAAARTGLGFNIERHVLALEMVRQTEPLFGDGLCLRFFG